MRIRTSWPAQRSNMLLLPRSSSSSSSSPSSVRRCLASGRFTMSMAHMNLHCRYQSTAATATATDPSKAKATSYSPSQSPSSQLPLPPPLAVLPTKSLIRSLLFTSVMSSPLLEPCLSLVKLVVNSKSPILNPSKNPPLNYLLRTTIYDHFCAGTNEAEVKQTVRGMKNMGFKGVILGYAREVVVDHESESTGPSSSSNAEKKKTRDAAEARLVEEWKNGNLKTLSMIGQGDFLSMKFTGAGSIAVEALTRQDPIPPSVQQAMKAICEQAARQGSRLWIDAEQQVFQDTIDAWTIDLMRTYNRNGRVVVYNTIQAYLKSSTENIQKHLLLAQNEGWTLGIKLVRGAYIAHDIRSRIHDTQEDTDQNYNNIVEKLVTKQFPFLVTPTTSESQSAEFPDVRLMVASHNASTVKKATALHRSRIIQGQPTIPVEFGQLQGMADEISCELVSESKRANTTFTPATANPDTSAAIQKAATPKAFKALAWGTTGECLHFLLRRAVENKGAVQRTKHMAAALRREAWRRLFRSS